MSNSSGSLFEWVENLNIIQDPLQCYPALFISRYISEIKCFTQGLLTAVTAGVGNSYYQDDLVVFNHNHY